MNVHISVLGLLVLSVAVTFPVRASAAGVPQHRYHKSAASIPACAHVGKPIALPAAFPRQFPFPLGTNIDLTKPLLKGQIGIYGFVPSRTFVATVTFFKREVVRAGLKLVGFEVDSPNDSEGTYQGHGKIGRWQVRSLPGCARAMAFSASSQPTG